MSRETGRETDSSSSGAQGRGGAAYPSGTQPYGSRQYPSLHPTQDAPEETPAAPEPPEEPRTETTLTTRIRINIPGSRPIPPVVVRTPVADAAPGTETEPEEPSAPVAEPAPEPVAAPEPAQAEEAKPKETSDWFAPRKSTPSAPAAPATPAAAPAATTTQAVPAVTDTQGTGFAGSATSGVPTVGTTPSSRPVTAPQGAAPGAGNPLYDMGTPATGTPMYEGTPAGGTPMYEGTPAGGTPMYGGGQPLYEGTPAGGTPMYQPLGQNPQGVPGVPGVPDGPQAPVGPTTGPVTGSASLAAPAPTAPFPGTAPTPSAPFPGGPGTPGAPAAPRLSDDTAILTPQQPAPQQPAPRRPAPGHTPGDTLSGGMQAVPPTAARPNLTPRVEEPRNPAPAAPRPAPAAAPANRAPAKKGRSKLVLAAAGVFGLAGLAYGAGLLLNHSDVPKGTTVLGVDIGGGTKEEAVATLEATLGKRAHAPLQLSVGGKKIELAPDKAGLSLDTQETVRGAAGSDYNPVSVIGSLFGGERVAKPVFPTDDEKLAVALTDLAGSSAQATEATIRFAPNKVTAVEGRSGAGLDVRHSMISVKDAFRAQVETGREKVVQLPVTTLKPSVSKTELDRAMKEFAQPAMSGLITIKAGDRKIDFGPARSLPQILSMRAADGRLVEVYDKKAIERLLDGAFDGLTITKADGTKHPVSADDVVAAMRKALLGTTKAERTQVIDLDGKA